MDISNLRNYFNNLKRPLLILGFVVLSFSCGSIKSGEPVAPKDPFPSDNRVSHGDFTSQNGKEVTGTAAIYLAEGSYVIRLEGLVAPDEPGLRLIAQANGVADFMIPLRASRGTTNYFTSRTPPMNWTTVIIQKNTKVYGTANLVSTYTSFY